MGLSKPNAASLGRGIIPHLKGEGFSLHSSRLESCLCVPMFSAFSLTKYPLKACLSIMILYGYVLFISNWWLRWEKKKLCRNMFVSHLMAESNTFWSSITTFLGWRFERSFHFSFLYMLQWIGTDLVLANGSLGLQ